MPRTFTPQDLVAAWESILAQSYREQLLAVANAYPDVRSLEVEYPAIWRVDHEFAQVLLERPLEVVAAGELALKNILPPDAKHPIHLRVEQLPEVAKVEIRLLRKDHIGKLIAVDGLVRRATDVRPRILVAAFQCQRCGSITEVSQDDNYLKEPLECSEDQGGCGRAASSTRWKLLTEAPATPVGPTGDPSLLSRFVDTQKDEIQENPDELRGGEQPRRLELSLEDDHCATVNTCDRVIMNGILRLRSKGSPKAKLTLFDHYLQVLSIEQKSVEFEEIKITPEEEKRIKDLAANPEIYSMIVSSIAPSIHGLAVEKEAIALQLFGGVRKEMPDGTRIRGDIHILLIGDPGVAKSQLLNYVSHLSPRGIYTSGKGSSAAGLTAAVVQTQEFGEGRWSLEAGALVLADKGLVCIDELDKMGDTDRESIHTAMEQQTVHIAKAGITATLQSRCGILAAANPKSGRFDENTFLPDQIDLDPALLSRFDIILTLTDKADEVRDGEVADHIIRMHLAGEIDNYQKETDDERFKEIRDQALMAAKPPLQRDIFRKYLAHAKRHCNPILTPEARQTIRDYYVSSRKRAAAGAISLTPRQIEAVIRLSEASARIRLGKDVTEDDVDRAMTILDHYLNKIARTEDGQIDITIVATGRSTAQWDRIKVIREVIKELGGGRDSMDGIETERLVEFLVANRTMKEETVRKDLAALVSRGEAYNPRTNRMKLME